MIAPNVYNRYFKVVGGKLGELLLAQLEHQHQYIRFAEAIGKGLGASKIHTHPDTGEFLGFEFDKPVNLAPGKWLDRGKYLYPKKNPFKSFWRELNKIGASVPKDVLKEFGLLPNGWLQDGEYSFGCSIVGFYTKQLFWVVVPSRHFGDSTMNSARAAKAAGMPDTDPVRMLWTPPMDWVEVTQTEYLNEWDAQFLLEQQLER